MAAELVIDRALPSAPDFERAVLGSVIITFGKALARVADIVQPDDFFRQAHKEIYLAMLELDEERERIDLLTLKTTLERRKAMGLVGGAAYVSSLTDGIPDVTNVERYAREVAAKSKFRRIIMCCNQAMHAAIEEDGSAERISSSLAASMQQLSAIGDRESRPMYDVMLEVDQRVAQRAKEGRTRAIVTGFPSLDYHRAIRRKALIVIGAPTSHGKTTFMINLALGAVTNDASVSATIFSLEMSDEDVTDPVLSMLSSVRLQNIQDRELDAWEERQVAAARDRLKQLQNTFFFADRIRDIDSLYSDCRRRKMLHGLDLVLVDYLQLVKGFDERTREQDVDQIARSLLLLAQDLDCAVVTGSQVNKEREKRSSGRLSVNDLKHGAVIGEHARVVLLFQRPRQDDKSKTDIPWCKTVFQIEKNSGRKTGDVPMHANLTVQRFAEGICRDNDCPYVTIDKKQESENLF